MRKKAIAIGALLGAIVGAAASAYLQKLWAPEPIDADDFGRRLANLEAEIDELERLQREKRRRTGIGTVGGTMPYSRTRDADIRDGGASA